MTFYDQSDSLRPPNLKEQQQNPNKSTFQLSEQQKNNLNKRLPQGFFLIKKSQIGHNSFKNKSKTIKIQYTPKKRQQKIDLNQPVVLAILQTLSKKEAQNPQKAKMIVQSVEGRNRQMEKIKNIIQRFRKHPKYGLLANFLSKIGMLQILNEIQTENKKGLLTIDTFRQRFMLVLESAKNVSYQQKSKQIIDEMIQQLLCYAEQARKVQFQNSIQTIQKSIDKITRYVSQSNWFIRKRKKGDKADTNYTQKQIMYIGDLVRQLPPAYLIGVLEIIQEKPVIEVGEEQTLTIKLHELTNRKLKDIQSYVKGKLSLLYRSRDRKAEKIRKRKIRLGIEDNEENQQNQQNNDEVQQDNQDNMNENREGSEYQFIQRMKKDVNNNDNEILRANDNSNQFFEEQNQYFIDKSENKGKNSPKIKEDVKDNQLKIQNKQKQNKQTKQNEVKGKVQEEQAKKQSEFVIEDDSMDENESSDSSMITDEDQSDF